MSLLSQRLEQAKAQKQANDAQAKADARAQLAAELARACAKDIEEAPALAAQDRATWLRDNGQAKR